MQLNSDQEKILKIIAYIIGGWLVFTFLRLGFGLYGFALAILVPALVYFSPPFRDWLRAQPGFKSRLSLLPNLDSDDPQTLAGTLFAYLGGLAFLSWLLLPDVGFFSLFTGVIGLALFYAWFIYGWRLPRAIGVNPLPPMEQIQALLQINTGLRVVFVIAAITPFCAWFTALPSSNNNNRSQVVEVTPIPITVTSSNTISQVTSTPVPATATSLPPTATLTPTTPPTARPTSTPLPTATPLPANTATPIVLSGEPTTMPTQAATPTTVIENTPDTPAIMPAHVTIIWVNRQDEYVDIQNTGGSAQDLRGWVLVSETGNQRCSLSGMLPVGSTLRIWANSVPVGQEGFACHFETPIWEDIGADPASLYDEAGRLIDRRL